MSLTIPEIGTVDCCKLNTYSEKIFNIRLKHHMKHYIEIPFTPRVVRFGVSSMSYLIGCIKDGNLTSFHGNSSSNSHDLSLHDVASGTPSLKYLDSSSPSLVL